jgi:hypothetical protein
MFRNSWTVESWKDETPTVTSQRDILTLGVNVRDSGTHRAQFALADEL